MRHEEKHFTPDVHLIGYACGAGARDIRCAMGPDTVMQGQIVRYLKDVNIRAQWTPIYYGDYPASLPIENIISDHIGDIQNKVINAVRKGAMPFVIGGDHTMAIGSWSGIAQACQVIGSLGLLWMDAHMDAHSVHTSHSGAYHGMPLGYLLGYGDGVLAECTSARPVIDPKHLVLVGVRSFEPEEHALLTARGIHIFFMEDVLKQGLRAVMKEALAIVSGASGGFGVSIDLDVFDPRVAPGTGSYAQNGLLKDETLQCLKGIARHPSCKGIEIAEFNPALDHDNLTLDLIEAIAQTVFI